MRFSNVATPRPLFFVLAFGVSSLFAWNSSMGSSNAGRCAVRGPSSESTSMADRYLELKKYWAGLKSGNFVIPQSGTPLKTKVTTGGSKRRKTTTTVTGKEPHGNAIDVYTDEPGADFSKGMASSFGGPDDTDYAIRHGSTGAITGEELRKLDPNDYYVAMRFHYGADADSGKAFWRGQRLLVVNPENGKAVVVRCVDWGPRTDVGVPGVGRIIDVSPGIMRQLDLVTDRTPVWVSFARPEVPIGMIPFDKAAE